MTAAAFQKGAGFPTKALPFMSSKPSRGKHVINRPEVYRPAAIGFEMPYREALAHFQFCVLIPVKETTQRTSMWSLFVLVALAVGCSGQVGCSIDIRRISVDAAISQSSL